MELTATFVRSMTITNACDATNPVRAEDLSHEGAVLMPDMGACPACTFQVWKSVTCVVDILFARPRVCTHAFLAVELKPKSCVDTFPLLPHLHTTCEARHSNKVCRFCCHQELKVAAGKWQHCSQYCPVRLFSQVRGCDCCR